MGHLNWSLVVDTVYMVVYGVLISFLINDPVFLRGFGFPQKNFFISFYLLTILYSVTVDVPIRIGMRALNRFFEK